MKAPQQEPIAVIGMANRFPGGSDSPSKLWELLRSPRDLSQRVPLSRFDSTGYFHPNGSHHGATDCRDAYFLDEDITRFDNAFFNIQPGEAEAIDPQQRLLMETIYESLCSAGQSIEGLRGSRTAVYVGQMCDDWSQMSTRDWELTPTYAATGQSRAIFSNRVSYFFDWHGPSMTIDTACSSSLVAVHQGVTALRNGECPVAIAAGVNLILAPGMWIAESKLHMLSPTGTSKMWDAAADGYARGEGVASVVLKPLSAALRDGDHIECVIRETGVNQDGRTAGLTMPSNIAQADLIRHTYERAGLDINDPKDRPQFFHAHGTGTPAGDPQEAEAISSAFFDGGKVDDRLYVGSIKTVIGHTEGAAGLASLIGTSLAMKHGIVPPNLHFNSISPKVAPFCAHLQVPTTAQPWPNPIPGQPRRASVNSFGFGGTNAHAIIESYENDKSTEKVAVTAFTPLTVSAASLPALRIMLSDLRNFLDIRPEVDIRDVAYTLQSRRSTLLYRKSIMSENTQGAIREIERLLSEDGSGEKDLASRSGDVSVPSILGVFTGQGAQWPRMGAHLIEKSPYVAERIAELDLALSQLPEVDRPDWNLRDEFLADSSASRLSEAALAQPLCTAVQIVLVDLLRMANIVLSNVVGHSSGEIGAAYAAGFLSATDAIRIAYYRGLFAKLACSQSENGVKGAMMAVGTSFEDALEFCAMEEFEGRIQVAARNSSTSMTLSGDEDAIEEALAIFVDEGRFARKLKVDTAYHSHHMNACAGPYLDALKRCKITTVEGNGTKWISSVVEGRLMSKEFIKPQYWVDNMTNAVLFAPAVATAMAESANFDMAIEFGPHPALKGPCLDTIQEISSFRTPYTGLLSRQKNDVEELGSALGAIWSQLGARSVDFNEFDKAISGVGQPKRLVVSDLPAYPFDHSRSFYTLSRVSGGHRNVHAPPHPLLGRRCVETETDDEVSWRNVLRQTEIGWLQGHQLQGQMVFPAMGYVSTAVEAAIAIAKPDQKLALISLENIVIGRALTFVDDNVGMEFKVTLKVLRSTDNELHAEIACHSGLLYNSSAPLALNFSTNVTLNFQEPDSETLPVVRMDEINLVETEPGYFYTQFTQLGYNYSPPFTGVRAIHRKMGFATGEIEDLSSDTWEDQLMLHPGWLDCALQTSFAAYSHPLDGRLNLLHVPTAIKSIIINPYFFTSQTRTRHYQYQATSLDNPVSSIEVDVDIFAGVDQSHACVQFESIQARPFAAPGPRDDACMFSRFEYKLAGPDAVAAVEGDDLLPPANGPIVSTAERMGFFYLRRLHETITPEEKAATLPHFQHLLTFASKVVGLVASGDHPTVPTEAIHDSHAFIRSLASKYRDRADVRLVEAAGENLPSAIRRNGSMLEHMMKDGLLDRLYEESAGLDVGNAWFARTVAQIAHRHPRMRLFEIGAGTGGTTRFILPILKDAFASYTFTDISAGFFERAQNRFHHYADRMSFATYNMERTPADQGFEEGSYDVVIASNVLHATGQLDDMMANVRRLLRPGGYLIALEIISNYFLHIDGIMGGLPGWWAGAAADPRRCDGPCLTLDQWDKLARQHGFAGVDSHTPMEHKLQSYAVFVCQAVDERVMSLRDPLAGAALASQGPSHLVVIGGSTPAVNKLSEELCEILSPRYTTTTRFVSLEELNTSGLAQGSTVVSLTELDQQFLEVRTASKIEALKTLWRHGGSILWVTQGARNERPYSSIILGLSRVVRYENPNINLQILDFDKAPVPSTLAEGLLRLEIGEQLKQEGVNILWSVEPEVHYVGDQILIPRLYPEAKLNARYNTYRRVVHESVNPQETTVVLGSNQDEKAAALFSPSPLRILPNDRLYTKTVTIQVEQSLLQMIRVSEEGFVGLCAGKNAETGEPLIALTDSAIESRLTVPIEWTVSGSGAALGALATQLFARSILATAPQLGTVLVHEADEVLKDTLQREAAKDGARVVFTTATKEKGKDKTYLFIHERLPRRLMQKCVPKETSLFVDLSPDAHKIDSLAHCLPPNTTTTTSSDYLRAPQTALANYDNENIGENLKAAWQAVSKQRRISSIKQVPNISLQDVTNNTFNPSLIIVDWNTSSVQICPRPIDFGTIFRADGTYLLVGLTGDLGQSLCRWMVLHGACNIVLSSRNPKVDPHFVESIESLGAVVKVMSLDITQRDSLRACYDSICAEMPPIIGVANGALILEDTMFDDLEFASMDRQATPKIDGSVLLDELFYDTPLDFFIMFCSIANVSGNTGQSPYVMANQFMTALAAQRRDLRGVSGSAMAISSVRGLGYFEHANRDYIMDFAAKGYRNISEQDVHQQFAEAILAGRPGTKEISEVVTGIIPFRDDENIHPQLRTDPKFRHFMIQDLEGNANSENGSGGNNGSPRARLATVKTLAEAITVVQESFINRLKRILMIQATEDVDPLLSLVELGADSIMAVDVRAWFLKELNVDVPVLKILGAGATIATLVEEAVGKIPTQILDLSKLEGKIGSQAPTEDLSSSKSTSISNTSSSPVLLPTPSTPPETLDSDGSQVLETEEKVTPTDWRKAIVDSSTEHIEQMTFGQNRFWFLSHYVEDPTTFNIAYMGKLTGRLRLDDLTRAVDIAAQRHETLRTRFFWSEDDNKTPMQGILSKSLVRLETIMIKSEDQAIEAYNAMSNYVWDLGDWTSLRMQLLVLSNNVQYLIMGSHHISMDGYSFNVLMLDINEAYKSPSKPLSAFPATSQARDFGAQQRKAHESGQLQPAIEHFRSILPPGDLTHPIELLPFSRTQVRPPLDSYSTHVARVRLESDVASKLKQLARGHRATSFHAYLAAFQALLFRLLPTDTTNKIFIGMADANRLDSKFMGSIGNFLNVLPLRFDRSSSQTVGKAIEVARESAYGALEHSGLPFDLLLDELEVPRSNSWAPVFQVFIDYRLVVREHADKSWAGCRIGEESWHASKSGYDVALEIVEDHEGAMLAVHVQKALYDTDGAELLVKSYANALREVARRGESFNLEKLQRWDGDDVKNALDIGKGPEKGLMWPATVSHQINEMIVKHANSIALKDGDGHFLTYAEMNDRVESIAHSLIPYLQGSDEQAVVGVFQMPSPDWICSLLAIHRVGAIYVPLDLRNSIPRLVSNVKAAQPTIILADSETVERTQEIGIEERVAVINISELLTKNSTRRIETSAKIDQAAYIIFTSGSTGEPKGIVVTHSGLRANLEGYHSAWNIEALASVVLQNAAFSFDASLLQIYAALTTGGCLLVVPADARGDPAEVTRLMAEHQVTMTQATPSEYDMWFRFASDNIRRCVAWKAAWFGGERAAPGLLNGFREACKVLPNLRVFTSYGPTEASISSMKGEANVRDPNLKVPVPGRLLPNYAAYIVDEEMQLVPIGVPGEIILGGAGVDRNEYLNRQDLTASHFLKDIFTRNPQPGWGHMYRTGDHGRLNASGFLTVEGRIAGDTQVKLRGFRIELAEIERVMVKESGGLLSHAVVTLRGDGEQDQFLAAHIVFEKQEQTKIQDEIIAKLHSRLPLCLPPYMCPAVIVGLNKVPLTAHSKVDRRAVQSLPLPEIEKLVVKQHLDLTPTERRLADLWAEVLPQRAIATPLEPRSDFFRAGGNSLLLVKLQAGIKRAFGDAPRLSKLMSAVELGSMAALLDNGVTVVDWDREMELGSLNEFSVRTKGSNTDNKLRILVTGATGSLGRRIIPRLVADEKVEQVICLVRNIDDRDWTKLFTTIGDKLQLMTTDLPSLPTDTDFSQITTVLHCAADRNFFDGYNAAKSINVDTAKILSKMCLQSGAKLHVLSSGALSMYEANDDNNNDNLPRPSPADGYVSSKWVAERYLARASRLLDLQVTAHRPTEASLDQKTKIEDAVAHDMLLISPKLGVRPDFSHLSGTIHVARLEEVAIAVVSEVISDNASHQGMRIINHAGTGQIQVENLGVVAKKLFEQPENKAVKLLPSVPALHWVGLAKRAGIFEWFFTAQHLVVADEEGRKVVTRR